MLTALLSNTLFIPHFVHVAGGIALKFAQAFDGAEIECFCMIVVAGSSIGNADFHFADWIDRHGRALLILMIPKGGEMFPEKAFSNQHSAFSQNSSAADERG